MGRYPVNLATRHPGTLGRVGRLLDAGGRVEVLEQAVRGELHLLVAPLPGPVDAGDERAAVHPAQVTGDERVPRLGLVRRPHGEPEVPPRVVLPGVVLEVGVLGVRARLHVTPAAVEHVLPLVDQVAHVGDRGPVDLVLSHRSTLATRRAQRGSACPSWVMNSQTSACASATSRTSMVASACSGVMPIERAISGATPSTATTA